MAFSIEDKVQRGLHFAIVDEVDSILIDEARTPLVISGAAESNVDIYNSIDRLIPQLEKSSPDSEEEPDGDFTIDEKSRSVELTEQGHEKVEQLLREAGLLDEDSSLYSAQPVAAPPRALRSACASPVPPQCGLHYPGR